jgi:D-alanyl-D-alanine carboxypeptidase
MKKILVLTATLVSFTGYASTSTNTQDITFKQKAVLQNFGRAILHDKGADSKKLTAISFATQCKNNAPIYAYEGTYSFKDRRTINQNSLFQVGSITKSFISVVILQLAQEHKFSLDNPDFMKKWFPEYPKWKQLKKS